MKIGYIETFPVVGLERWRKIPLEVEVKEEIDFLNATDEEIEAFMVKVNRVQYALKKQVQKFFFESKGHDEKVAAEAQKEVVLDEAGRAIADILLCKTIAELETFQFPASQSKAIKAAYNQKLKQLQNGLEQPPY